MTEYQSDTQEVTQPPGEAETPEGGFEILSSRQFPSWLSERGASIGFTTYQSGKLFFIGTNSNREISIFERSFERPMGLYADDQQIWLSTLYTLYRFTNSLPEGSTDDGFDRTYIPQAGYVTGDLDIHDLGITEEGRPVFVCTLFGCLATTDNEFSFRPLWQPSHLTDLAPEDRTHLNGLAMRDGKPAYVTAIAESDVVEGWRDHRTDGGIVIDVDSKEIVARGLSMPHSPRLYRDELWVANSGTGELGTIDPGTGKFEAKAFLPGYIRGLSFIDKWAVVGLSKPRRNRTFSGLPLDDRLADKKTEARCGIYIVNIETGHIEHWLHVRGVITELYDVVVVPGVRRANFIGFRNDQVRRTLNIGPSMDFDAL